MLSSSIIETGRQMFISHGDSRTLKHNLTWIIIIANICVYVRKAALKLEMKIKKWNIEGIQKSVNAPVDVERANYFKHVHLKNESNLFPHKAIHCSTNVNSNSNLHPFVMLCITCRLICSQLQCNYVLMCLLRHSNLARLGIFTAFVSSVVGIISVYKEVSVAKWTQAKLWSHSPSVVVTTSGGMRRN